MRVLAWAGAMGVWLACAGMAQATQEYLLPTLFDVTGVVASDVLNVRAGPGVQHAVVGRLAPDAEGVEVVALDRTGRWGRVAAGNTSGWASMRFLRYRTDVWQPETLPERFRCLGTEPFWALAPQDGKLTLRRPDARDLVAEISAVLDTGVFRDPTRAVVAASPAGRLVVTAAPAQCSDGMSDLRYGLAALLVAEEEGVTTLYSGCCRIGH